jgi:phage host-nuclease inhibitor protein Gam
MMTIEGAKVCLEQIAHAECRIASKRARYEKVIAAAKSRFEEETTEDARIVRDRADQLCQFILAHPDLFAKPRAVKTEFGSFGLRAVSNVEIADADAVIQFAMDRGYPDIVKTAQTLIKPALRQRLDDGEKIPGCQVLNGDEAFYKLDKALLESAETLAVDQV